MTKLGNHARRSFASLAEVSKSGNFLEIAIEELHENDQNPRTTYDEQLLHDMAETIREKGIVQPLVVKRRKEGGYRILAGHRRRRAALLVGLTSVPAVVRDDINDDDDILIALIENDQKADLNPIERARAYAFALKTAFVGHGSKKELAKSIGQSPVFVSRHLALLDLPADVQALCEDGIVRDPVRLAALGSLDDEAKLAEIGRLRGDDGAVRPESQEDTGSSSLRDDVGTPSKRRTTKRRMPDPDIARLERRIAESLATKVAIKPGMQGPAGKGTVVVHYTNLDVLQGILDKLGLPPE